MKFKKLFLLITVLSCGFRPAEPAAALVRGAKSVVDDFRDPHFLDPQDNAMVLFNYACNTTLTVVEALALQQLGKSLSEKCQSYGLSPVQISFLGVAGSAGLVLCRFFATSILFRLHPYAERAKDDARITSIVSEACAQCDVPMVDVFVKPLHAPEAYVTGTRTMVVTQGFLNQHTDPEIQAVVFHELRHLSEWHPFIRSSLAAITTLICGLLLESVAPTIVTERDGKPVVSLSKLLAVSGIPLGLSYLKGMLCVLQEFQADAFSAQATNSLALVDALVKMLRRRQCAAEMLVSILRANVDVKTRVVTVIPNIEGLIEELMLRCFDGAGTTRPSLTARRRNILRVVGSGDGIPVSAVT